MANSGEGEGKKSKDRKRIPAAALKRFAHDLELDSASNKFLQINRERVSKFIEKPFQEERPKSTKSPEKDRKTRQVAGIYEYKREKPQSLLQLQSLPEFNNSLGVRSRYGEGDGSFFDLWLTSNVTTSKRLTDKDGMPIMNFTMSKPHTGFKKHIADFRSSTRAHASTHVKSYSERRAERLISEGADLTDLPSIEGTIAASLSAATSPNAASANGKAFFSPSKAAGTSAMHPLTALVEGNKAASRPPLERSNTATSGVLIQRTKLATKSYSPTGTDKLPPISPVEKDNYFGGEARVAFFDYYRQLSRQRHSVLDGVYTKEDVDNMMVREAAPGRGNPNMVPSSREAGEEDGPSGTAQLRRMLSERIKLENTRTAIDTGELLVQHLTNRATATPVVTRNPAKSAAIESKPPSTGTPPASQRPLSARTKFLIGCVNKNIVPQPSLIIRKDLNSILNISFLGIGDQVAQLLAESLESLPLLEGLYIADNKLTDVGLVPIINSLYRCPLLKCLDLSQNKVDMKSAGALSAYLTSDNCNLAQLVLGKADVDDIEACLFMEAIAVRHTIVELDLSSNILGSHEIAKNSIRRDQDTAGESIGRLLKDRRCAIETLKLSWNMIRFKSGIALMSALKVNQTITYLDVSYNGFSADGGEMLGDALHNNKSLVYLKVAHNNITSRPCYTILSGIRSCNSLKEVDMTENPIGEGGARALLALNIHQGHRLSIDFKGCSLRLKDPSCWFDPSKPNSDYTLHLSNPYERSVCIELLRLVAENDDLKITRFACTPAPNPDEPGNIPIEQELSLQLYTTKNDPAFKKNVRSSFSVTTDSKDIMYEIAQDIESARNLFRQAADRIFHQYDTDESESLDRKELEYLLKQLGLESSKQVIDKLLETYDTDGSGRVEEDEFIYFLLDVKDTYEKAQDWTKESRYVYLENDPLMRLRKDIVGAPAAYMPPDSGTVNLQVYGERTLPDFIHTISHEDVETMLHSSKTVADSGAIFEYALTLMKVQYQEAKTFYRIMLKDNGNKLQVLKRLLPRMATPMDARLFLASVAWTDFERIHNLKALLGNLYRIYIGIPNGFYRLNLADASDVYCFQRLVELSNTYAQQRQRFRQGDTSQNANWMSFRNTVYDGKPFVMTKELIDHAPTKGRLEFDFVGLQAAQMSSREISNLRLYRVLCALGMVQEDGRAKAFDKINTLNEEGKVAGKGSGIRKWETSEYYAMEAALELQRFYQSYATAGRLPRVVRDISMEESVLIDIKKSPREMENPDYSNAGEAKIIEIYSNHLKQLQAHSKKIDKELIAHRYLDALENILCGRFLSCAQLGFIVEHFPHGNMKMNEFTTFRVELVVMFFARLNDLINFDYVLKELKAFEYAMVIFRLGWLNIWNPLKAEGYFYLDLARREERQLLRVLIVMGYVEPGESWLEAGYRANLSDAIENDEWELPFEWYSESGLPAEGVVSLQYFSGRGMQLRGCHPDLSCRMALMGVTLARPYDEELRYFHEVSVEKAEAVIEKIESYLSFITEKQDPTAAAAAVAAAAAMIDVNDNDD